MFVCLRARAPIRACVRAYAVNANILPCARNPPVGLCRKGFLHRRWSRSREEREDLQRQPAGISTMIVSASLAADRAAVLVNRKIRLGFREP